MLTLCQHVSTKSRLYFDKKIKLALLCSSNHCIKNQNLMFDVWLKNMIYLVLHSIQILAALRGMVQIIDLRGFKRPYSAQSEAEGHSMFLRPLQA